MQVVNHSNIGKRLMYYWSKWNLREKDFSQFVLTEVCEIRIIELPKLMKMNRISNREKTLEKWVKFLLTPNEMEEVDMENNVNIKKAKQEFDEIEKLNQ